MKRLLAIAALLLLAPPLAGQSAPPAPAQPSAHAGHMPAPPPAFQPLTTADITPIEHFPVKDGTRPEPIPASGRPDVVGAFRIACNFSHLSYDDPIAYPGQPGKAHLHHFFGNTLTDAHSTYASLRNSGESTCQGDRLNRSAYWIPALLDGKGNVVVPDLVGLYYKRRPAADPECTRAAQRCTGIPPGLRAIFGTNYIQKELESQHVRFDCNGDATITATIPATIAKCPGATTLYARVHAPDCWNGRDLDSADHQAHLAYQSRDRNTGLLSCPRTHPLMIPELTLTVAYSLEPDDTPAQWRFSSDVMANAVGGSTFHADYMEAWEPQARLAWEAACIDKLLNCSAGNLGDGRIMKQPKGFTFVQRPRLIRMPRAPG